MGNMFNRWLFAFAAIQAIGAVFSILTFFGITSSTFKGHMGPLVISVILAVCSSISFYVLFRGRQTHILCSGTPIPVSLAPSTPLPSAATPIGVIPVATESAPVILGGDNPISTVRVGVGDYREFLCEGQRVRITVKQILTNDPKKPLALLHVDAEGRIVYGSDETKKDNTNQYLVPQKTDVRFCDEQECSLYFYNVSDDGKYFRFFRAYVEHINPHASQVVLNVFSSRTTYK